MPADRVKETSATTGTDAYTLDGAVAGFQSVIDGVGNGEIDFFCAEDGTDWEVFEGGVMLEGGESPVILTRDTVLASSNAGNLVDWGAGTKNIFVVLPAKAIKRMMPGPAIWVDGEFNGAFFLGYAGESFALGDIGYLKSDGYIMKADATDAAKNGLLVMATGTILQDEYKAFLRNGFIRNDLWWFTPGATLYVPSGAGSPSESYPAAGHTEGGYAKRIAYAHSETIIQFCPGMEFSSIAAARALFAGGFTTVALNVIDYVTIVTTGNATDFGDLSVARRNLSACSSSIRGLIGGGFTANASNVIDFVTIVTTGNAADFGDLTEARQGISACSSAVRGLFAGGYSLAYHDTIDYVILATTGNATDFGNLTTARMNLSGCSSAIRGLFDGGHDGNNSDIIDYVTIATTGDATDFGNLTAARRYPAACSSSVRGLFAGGLEAAYSNVIDCVTIATTGDATDFGDLTVARTYQAGSSSGIRGLFGGGTTGPASNVIDYVTIATAGNGSDFGDLTVARMIGDGACSNGHGGLL